VELMSSFHRARREQRINGAQFLQASNRFAQDDLRGVWEWVPVDEDLMAYAAGIYLRLPEKMVLYGVDCVHLAAAIRTGHEEIFTHDDNQFKAAEFLGLTAVRIS
jgi:predicted nucleic acid-binding protein